MSNKKGSAPPRYDEEFKKGAMALVTEKGMPLKSAAKDLGICPDTLRSWLNASDDTPSVQLKNPVVSTPKLTKIIYSQVWRNWQTRMVRIHIQTIEQSGDKFC